jgi:sulfatase maturation enzyme AslB (radical SAM superfamily)
MDKKPLPKITSAFFIVTQMCNMKCTYCFVHKNPSQMGYHTALDATNFLIKNAEETGVVPSVNFSVGSHY